MRPGRHVSDVRTRPTLSALPVVFFFWLADPTGTSTGRSCDGFEFSLSEGALAAQSPSSALTYGSSPFADPLESRSLQYFSERTIGELETFFPDALWSSHVLQLALSQEGIRHALVSLAAHHERFANPDVGGEPIFAFRQHSLAVRSLLADEDPSMATPTHLVSCLIFVCIEALQNKYRSAIQLFRHGVSMAKELRRRADAARTSQSGSSSASGGIITAIEAFINRFAVQVALVCILSGFGAVLPFTMLMPVGQLSGDLDPTLVVGYSPGGRRIEPETASFASLSEARKSILDLATDIIAQPSDDDGKKETTWAHAAYGRWCRNFDKLVRERSDTLPPRGIALLELHKRYLGLHLAAPDLTIQDPSRLDEDTPAYEDLISFAETAVGTDVEEEEAEEAPTTTAVKRKPQFHMDLGVLPILFSTVLRCRDAGVRQRAISLMKSTRLQEGIWPSTTTSHVAETILRLEQQTDDVAGPPQRVQSVSVVFDCDEKFVTVKYGLRDSVYQEVLAW